jgi:serine/threonine-protein kinase
VAQHLLAGRYRLVERLGAGGMSVVWRAYDEVLGRPVAVKVLAPRFAADPESRDRIRGEARAAARLSHPNITNVYDYSESDEPGGRTVPFVVMELVEGVSLEQRLGPGALPWRFAVEVCAQVAAALAAVHVRGLVHRDVKPANIMLTPDGVKVVDFGVSAIAGSAPEPDGRVYGTPAYLAPERLDGTPANAASDVYALGLVLYRAIAGRLPWDADTATQMLTAHCYVEPEPLPAIEGLPPAVADLCRRCLAKNPGRRPGAAEIMRVLAEVVDVRVPAPAVPLLRPEPQPTRALRRPDRRRLARALGLGRHHPVRAWALGGALAAAVLMLVTWAVPDGSPPSTQAAGDPPAAAADDPATRPELGCQVRYVTRSDAAGNFSVDLTVTNTGTRPLPDWVLVFDYPGDQQVIDLTGGAHSQDGGRVHLAGAGTLAPGGSATVGLRGTYSTGNPMPTAFELEGMPCTGQLVGASGNSGTSGATGVSGGGGGRGAADDGNSGPGSSNSGSSGKGSGKKDKRGGGPGQDGD